MATEESADVRRGDQPATLKDVAMCLCVFFGIIGLFRLGCMPLGMGPDPTARFTITKASIDGLSAAIEKYHSDCGQWPSEAQGLMALCTNAEAVAGWKGPYVQGEGRLTDSWGYAFKLRTDGQKRMIVSPGPDCEFGTRDDISGAASVGRGEPKGSE